MPRTPNKPTDETVEITAEFTQDPVSGEWIATSLQGPRISARSMEMRRARTLLSKQLSERTGKIVVIVDKVKLPKNIAEQVAAYQRDLEKQQELKASLEERFMPLVKVLLRERLQQQQIAGLLRISTQRLGQLLKGEATPGR